MALIGSPSPLVVRIILFIVTTVIRIMFGLAAPSGWKESGSEERKRV